MSQPVSPVAAVSDAQGRTSDFNIAHSLDVDAGEESCLPNLVRKLTSFRRALVLERKQSQQQHHEIERLTSQLSDTEAKIEEQVSCSQQQV